VNIEVNDRQSLSADPFLQRKAGETAMVTTVGGQLRSGLAKQLSGDTCTTAISPLHSDNSRDCTPTR